MFEEEEEGSGGGGGGVFFFEWERSDGGGGGGVAFLDWERSTGGRGVVFSVCGASGGGGGAFDRLGTGGGVLESLGRLSSESMMEWVEPDCEEVELIVGESETGVVWPGMWAEPEEITLTGTSGPVQKNRKTHREK